MLIIDDFGGPPQQINGKRFISKSKQKTKRTPNINVLQKKRKSYGKCWASN